MHTEHRAGAERVRAEYVCRIGESLAVTGRIDTDGRPGLDTHARPNRRCRAILFPRPSAGGTAPAGHGFLAVCDGPLDDQAFTLDVGPAAVTVDARTVEVVDIETLAWLGLASIDKQTRVAASTLVAATATADPALLRRFRDAVRERLPHVQIAPDQPMGLFVDGLYRLDDRHFYVRGWMRDGSAEVASLAAVSPEGARAELADSLLRFARPDVEQFYGASPEEQGANGPAFAGCFELDSPSRLPDGWLLEMRNSRGDGVEVHIAGLVDDPGEARATVLGDLVLEEPGHDQVVRTHTWPALRALQARGGEAEVETVTQYGTPSEAPDVSVIIPLYRRIDFVEHQMAQFVDDADLRRADIVYVLDSPELASALAGLATAMHRLYGVPFRTVVLRRNVGYAGANNAAAAVARGRLLLLLNSDVIPDRPGWLSRLVEFHDRTPGLGAVGPKLVYEDESIQHAGMYFQRDDGAALWENFHYFKGLHRCFPPACEMRIVPALTGACLLLSAALWRRVGGLSGAYVQGDYEDSDLCLRIAQRGLDCWYLPDVELYHLEGQSYPTHLRQLTSRFNTWLHTHLWDDRITATMKALGRPSPDPIGA